MGSTTSLRQHLKTEFDPFVAARGFSRDDRESPQRQIYRRVGEHHVDVFDIQWEKYGRPRFVVNYGRVPRAGLERNGVHIPAADLAPEDSETAGLLRPGSGADTRSWFRQDPSSWRRVLLRSAPTPPAAVTRQLCELFAELESFWTDGTLGPHMTSRAPLPSTRQHAADSLRWFAFGFLLSAICAWLVADWYTIANDVFGLGVVFDTRPPWLVAVMAVLDWAPWVVLALLTVIWLRRGPVVRPLAFATGAVSVYAAILVWLFGGPIVADYRHRSTFDTALWRENPGRHTLWPARLTMVDDLLARHPLVGLPADSVERLLGPRDSTEYFDDWDYVYWLGPERGVMRLDSEWLGLRLGANRIVSEARILRD